MKFPKAGQEDELAGWRYDVAFLNRIKAAAGVFYDPLDMDIEEIQSVLLALTVWEAFEGARPQATARDEQA